MALKDKIRIRRDTTANFTSTNPVLALGEISFDTTTKQFKVGDGSTAWVSLAYSDISATNLTTGTLPDARLSAKVKSLADLATPASTQLLAMNASGAVVSGSTFESVSKNALGYPATITYNTDGSVNTVTYTLPSGSIVKTFSYSSGNVSTIVLSGNTPSGISLTKTLTYTGDNITGVSYS